MATTKSGTPESENTSSTASSTASGSASSSSSSAKAAPETGAETTEAPAATSSDLPRLLAAEGQVKTHVAAAMALAAAPVPLLDMAAVTLVQLRMLNQISKLYGKPFSEKVGRKILSAVGGGVLGVGAGVLVGTSLAKLIPGVGWAVGAVSMPIVTGASTYAIGRAFVKVYEEGGSMFDMNIDSLKAYYAEEFEKGKTMAAQAKAEAKAAKDEAKAKKVMEKAEAKAKKVMEKAEAQAAAA